MKFKFISLLLLNLIISQTVHCQVYVSEVSDDEIIIGPDNVNKNKEVIASFYVSDLNDIKRGLLNSIEYELNVIKELNEKERLKRKERKELKRVNKIKETIDSEIYLIDSILNQWNGLWMIQEKLIEASLLIAEGKCIEFTTQEGKYYSDECTVKVKTYVKKVEWEEIIPVEYADATTKWIKKKSNKNCLSANPDDCLVWCLIEIQEGHKFNDITGKEYVYDSCPTEFYYDEQHKRCSRKMAIYEDGQQLEAKSLVINNSKELVTLIDWKEVDCE